MRNFIMFFGLFSRKRLIYKLRKKYDRIREKADKLPRGDLKFAILKTLDQVEPALVRLEEENVSLLEKTRLIRFVKAGIARAKYMLKTEEIPEQMSRLYQPSKRLKI